MIIKRKLISQFGFTLLELLVVIGIIAVLVAFGTVSYATSQKKARDAKRKADLHSFQNALEQCYSVNNYQYPKISGGGSTTISIDCSGVGGPSLTISDPTTHTYTVVGGNGPSYSISITLEDSTTETISNQQ